jgi:zinc-ribbon domain
MIVHCPSCSTRHTLQSHHFADGPLTINCRNCGKRWQERDEIDIIDVPVRVTSRPADRVIEHDHAPELEARRLAEIARDAEASFASAHQKRQRTLRNWAAYLVFALTPFAGAALFPEAVVSAAPITIKAYDRLGYDINIYGLELRRVERQHAIINGTRVLSIKGDILNVSNDQKKLPWLRFALEDNTGKELYTWTLDTAARPLRAGELTGFTTRVASPPEGAQNLKIRFARSDEIGSKVN